MTSVSSSIRFEAQYLIAQIIVVHADIAA